MIRFILILMLCLPAFGQVNVLTVPNMTSLRATVPNISRPVMVQGYYTPGDGGGGLYVVTNTVAGTNAYGGRVPASGGANSWQLDYTDTISTRQFGATNKFDISARSSAASFLATTGRKAVVQSADATVTGNLVLRKGNNRYAIFDPAISTRLIYNADSGALKYNHDASIAWYQDRFFALWNANTNASETRPGQFIAQSTSTDGTNWSSPVQVFISSTYSSNPVTYDWADDMQWQPSLVVVGSELWCMWSQQDFVEVNYPASQVIYFSKLTSPTGKWQNNLVNLNLSYGGRTYYGFPTQNPTRLQSGRVLAPLTWIATNFVPQMPSYWNNNTVFWSNYKRAGVIYTDNGGATWSIGGHAGFPTYDNFVWEPTVYQMRDGAIHMVVRNLDYKNAGTDKSQGVTQLFNDGEAAMNLDYYRVHTSSSRIGTLVQDGEWERVIGLGNDWKPTGSNASDRANLALFHSRSGRGDLTPGVSIDSSTPPLAYPQAVEHDGKLWVIYSSGDAPRSIKLAQVESPETDQFYVHPRSNDEINPFVGFSAGPPAVFQYQVNSTMQAVTNTYTWGSTTKASAGIWMFRHAESTYEGLVDNRLDATTPSGFLFGLNLGVPQLVLPTASGSATFTFSTIDVPTNQWVYVGVSIDLDADSSTAYYVNAAGTATTETIATVTTVTTLDGATLNLGRAKAGSVFQPVQGNVRHVWVLQGVANTANNHRYWHGIDQATLGATDWAGTETNPGTAFADLWAGDADAGLNNESWLLRFSATGNSVRGSAVAATVDGRTALTITGSGSASLEIPPHNQDEQALIATAVKINAKGADQVILTVGDSANRYEIVSRSGRSDLEVFSSRDWSYTSIGNYVTNTWLQVAVELSAGKVRMSIGSSDTVIGTMPQEQPSVYLGQGFLYRVTSPEDSLHFDIGGSSVSVVPSASYVNGLLYAGVTNITIGGRNPVVTFSSTTTNVQYIIANGNSLLVSSTNNATSSNAALTVNVATGQSTARGTGARLDVETYGASPQFIGTRVGGTVDSKTAVLANDVLSFLGGAGWDGTANTAAKGAISVAASENWGASANGTAIRFSTTPNSGTDRWDRMTIGNDGNVTIQNAAPILTLTATNGSSGARIIVGGTSGNGLRIQDENSNTRFAFYTNGVFEIQASGKIRLAPSGPTISFGSGAPSASEPNGSTYHRTDGTGPNLYVRENGAWVAK